MQRFRRRVRTPTLLQMEAVECGAAALGIVLRYYGRIVPLAELRQVCGVSRDGSTATNITRAARHYGLVAKGLKREIGELQELRCPYIVFWNFNHFLVVEGFRGQRVYLNDPATGRRTISFEEFDGSFTGVVLALEPGNDFTPGGRELSAIAALRTRLRTSRGALLYCILTGLLLVFPGLLIPVFTQLFVDYILIQGLQDWLRPLLLGMVLTVLLRGGLLRLQLRQLRRLQLKLATVMSSQFLWHLLQLPTSFYTQRNAGEISSRTALNDKVASVLSGQMARTAIDLVMISLYAVLMFYYDVVLTLIGLGAVSLNFLALHGLSRRRADASMRLLNESGKLDGIAIGGLQTIETIKASALESSFFSRWAGHFAKAQNEQQNLNLTSQTLEVLPLFLSTLITMLILVIGGFRVMDGHLSIGMLVAFQSLTQSIMGPVTTLISLGSTLQELRADLYRLDDVLGNPKTSTTKPSLITSAITIDTFRLHGQVEVSHLTFGYTPVGQPLIEDLSFTINPGQWIALVGASGSGKSTIAKLLCGLYTPWSGDIRFDGITCCDVPSQVRGTSLAFVDQELTLFAGTIRDNLTLWDTTISAGQFIQAGKDAAIHDTVVSLPGGYDHMLIEGAANLSGGQRQRLEIARALVHDPSILVLDEATSALDTETEMQIMRNLRRRNISCITVAHRLSTIRDCDEIIVLDAGRVVQRGTHDRLQREDGLYKRLLSNHEHDS